MPFPSDFFFSQNNLQTFVDCQRRFELLYLLKMKWPAVQTEPVLEQERHIRLGERFHQMVYQHHQGIPVDVLSASASDPDLSRWWQNYLQYSPSDLPVQQNSEYFLSIPFLGFRIMARYDLLAHNNGKSAVIIDWKTSLHKIPSHFLANRIQTRLYPFILAKSLTNPTTNELIAPDQISMIYWFPNFPRDPVTFAYDSEKFTKDQLFFSELISKISTIEPGNFPLTDDIRKCRFCVYRSLCDRGREAGDLEQNEDQLEEEGSLFSDIDPEQIAAIAF